MKTRRSSLLLLAALVSCSEPATSPALLSPGEASLVLYPGSNCDFSVVGTTWTLQNDCTTSNTIVIPAGVTIEGNGRLITAVDPAGGHFLGAVLYSFGSSAKVNNTRITASGLANRCDERGDRLRGILFEESSGAITNNTVFGVRQGLSGCQEGNAIEARHFGLGPRATVTISGNRVSDYQKNGITANGSLNAVISGNSVMGDGPIDYIAQNGIQVGFRASAVVEDNDVSGNDYMPRSWVACGTLYYDATGVRAHNNRFGRNERNQCNFGKGTGNVNAWN